MRLAIPLAIAALAAASPAFATGGFECRPVSGNGPIINLAVGHTISARPLSVMLRDGRRTLSTDGRRDPLVLGQSWIDGRHLWLDLLDAQALRYEGRLRATFQPQVRGRPAIGTFVRNGRTWRMRCVEA